MGKRSTNTTTPQVDSKRRRHHHSHPHQRRQQNVIMGPITRAKHDKAQHKKRARYHQVPPSRLNVIEEANHVHHDENPNQQQGAKAVPHLAAQGLLVAMEILLLALLLLSLLPLKHITLHFQELLNDWDEWSRKLLTWMQTKMGIYIVVASPTEIESLALTNSTVHAMIKYAKMASYPFLLFVPSLLMISAAIFSVTAADQTKSERRSGRQRVLTFMSICTGLLYLFLSVMLACAETSRWITLGLISGATPVILMLLARLSVVYADTHSGGHHVGVLSSGDWTTGLSQGASGIAKAVQLLSFVFVFLPFLAGFFYVVSPPYLLAIPFSSFTTCTIAGIFGVLPSIISIACLIIGCKMAFWAMRKSFGIYTWLVRMLVNRHGTLLLFLTCIALTMTIRELQVPSYL